MRTPTYTVKLPPSLKVEIAQIQLEFGVPSERQAVAACVATIGELMRQNKISRLYPPDPVEPPEMAEQVNQGLEG
jgi:hypothetical protein